MKHIGIWDKLASCTMFMLAPKREGWHAAAGASALAMGTVAHTCDSSGGQPQSRDMLRAGHALSLCSTASAPNWAYIITRNQAQVEQKVWAPGMPGAYVISPIDRARVRNKPSPQLAAWLAAGVPPLPAGHTTQHSKNHMHRTSHMSHHARSIAG